MDGISMQVASASMAMSQANLEQQLHVSMIKRTMEAQEAQAATLINQMLKPPSSNLLDVYV